ncbi:hypothetical protein VOLCADRAFT_90053 [Volvox carteri f. nagariensis]|uniref:Uncharacterized protein n=1 Tax=Volvox carteri f. nagariensis TaxID=3068 RepID=D8TTD2_VOLCA|nr:uncharacterized protein VOLCADRAFT_90053 [Volvox carteri f. nagariensis]EFJ49180.1 hypothetical protein VOLCADRAFT_90053 [Volvox carteri f. nagariensis]|eukprot:XP_002949628.1 hypothetical protein VOLCADRAFT_90053 [Volvox carteri f. nagariensis]
MSSRDSSRNRSIGSLTFQGRQEPADEAAEQDEEYENGFEADANEPGCGTMSRAAAERIRLRRILDGGGATTATAAAAADDPLDGSPPTEQDGTCEVAAAGIIVLFPDSLGKLRKLLALDLSRNVQLVALPDALCDLTALTRARLTLPNPGPTRPSRRPIMAPRTARVRHPSQLDSNQLSYLPPECASLPSLTALHVSYNRLTALPSELGDASSLTGIFANHNKLTALPATLGHLRQRLADLQLHNNELTVLPRELGLLAALTRITTGCNPLVHPPLAVARRGVAAVREYLLADWHEPEEPQKLDLQRGTGVAGEDADSEQQPQPGREHEPDIGDIGAGGARVGVGEPRGVSSARRWRRLMLSVACKGCVDKEDRIEELGQLLRGARERLERAERQLEHSQEKIRRQAQDLTVQTQRSVQLDAEVSRLSRQLAEAASLAAPLSRRLGGGGRGGSMGYDRRAEEMEEHLRKEVKEARGAAEAAGMAAEAAEREARRLRRDLERREQEVFAHRERAEELSLAVARERERCNAAVAAATEATQQVEQLQVVVKERDELRKRVEAMEKASQEAWRAAQVARDGHLTSEANADVVQAKLVATEAANRRLAQQVQEERAAAARAALEAESRLEEGEMGQNQLQLESARLRADLAALTAEREVLHDLTRPQAPAAGRSGGASTGSGYVAGGQPRTADAVADVAVRSAWVPPQRI